MELVAWSWLSALFPFRCQGIEIAAAFFHQCFFHKTLNRINYGSARTGIIAASLKKFV